METSPILYSFRRCPYAMRARMAIAYSNTQVELREILLKDKPQAMLSVSPKATVPVLVLEDNNVIDESRDVMMWALSKNDPNNWYMGLDNSLQLQIDNLIDKNDNEFKPILDRYKYAVRFPDDSEKTYRDKAQPFLKLLNNLLIDNSYLLGKNCTLADIALFPFIRQFAHVNKIWFDNSEYQYLQLWLQKWLDSNLFKTIMVKFNQWKEGDDLLIFPQS